MRTSRAARLVRRPQRKETGRSRGTRTGNGWHNAIMENFFLGQWADSWLDWVGCGCWPRSVGGPRDVRQARSAAEVVRWFLEPPCAARPFSAAAFAAVMVFAARSTSTAAASICTPNHHP